MQAVVKEHEKILTAVQHKNMSLAMDQMRLHLENSRDAVKTVYEGAQIPV
ncbi:MAG: hypothetical protein U5K27_09100 [Desulfotignum sp.]|nr:hypothetical protein [Desulfotignum sp.]